MVFSSVVFMCLFLPIVYFSCSIPNSIRVKNTVLAVASIIFYAYGEPIFIFVLIGVSFLHYISVILWNKHEKTRKPLLISLIIIDIFLLFAFKYFGFFTNIINSIFKCSIPVIEIELPIGISFFTFQIMSYAIDAYKDKSIVQKNFFNVLLYISFFPQLIAGPIVKYSDIAQQIEHREISAKKQNEGFCRFIFGLAQKVIISNSMAVVADEIFAWDSADITMPAAWLAAIAYSMQIYYDFCGYSNMAIGIGRIFGFEFAENFNYPYTALNIRDFWKRWHISLTSWFREYIYIPLGGNRKGMARTCLNTFIVFLLTGLWHGAAFTFIVWGLYYAVFMILERLKVIPIDKVKSRFIKHAYTLFVVFTGFLMFRAESMSQFSVFFKALFSFGTFTDAGTIKSLSLMTPWFVFALILACFFSNPFIKNKIEKHYEKKAVKFALTLSSVVLLAVCMIFLVTDSYNPFIYFNF